MKSCYGGLTIDKQLFNIILIMVKVGLREFRTGMDKYIKKASKEEVVVYRHSKPLFRLAIFDEEPWEEVIDFTKIRRGGVAIEDLLARL